MDTEIDLTKASRKVMLAVIAQQQAAILELQATVAEQQAVIARLQRRIESPEGKAKPGGPPGMPGIRPKSGQRPPGDEGPRKSRPHGFARQRLTPTHWEKHVLESCPQCGTGLAGGWVHRTREVIDIPVVPFRVTGHVFVARTCPVCERRRVPRAALNDVAVGRQRFGVNLVSLITALREEGRLPIWAVRWFLRTVHRLHLSLAAIVRVTHGVAQQAQPQVAAALDQIRASPVVHADETGWRQDRANGYVWTFTTPHERYFLCRGRSKEVVDEALGESFSGVLVSDFHAAYNHHPGLKRRCWAHLLRDIHDLETPLPQGGQSSPVGPGRPPPVGTGEGVHPPPGRGNAGWLRRGLSRRCWPDAGRSWRTPRQFKPNYAGVLRVSSRNCLSLWPSLKRHRTTTPQQGASGIR